ncbi:MAG: NmrA/HSCARG family protein [Syntrophobacteraceae bacterium]
MSKSSERLVLVTGGTGNQGGATVTHLLMAKRVRIRVLTRNPDSSRARRLASQGVELIGGDLDDAGAVKAALSGVSAAFSVQGFMDKGGVAAEERRGKDFADATKAAGAPHLVYSSVEGAERQSGIPHFESKWQVEQHIRELGIPATILRPVAFMDNFAASSFGRAMALGLFRATLGTSKRVQLVATSDIGWFAARALEDPASFAARIIPLAGDELSVAEIIKTYKNVTGHTPWVAPIPRFLPGLMMPKDIATMFQWMEVHGFEANISTLRQQHPGLLSFAAWLKARSG